MRLLHSLKKTVAGRKKLKFLLQMKFHNELMLKKKNKVCPLLKAHWFQVERILSLTVNIISCSILFKFAVLKNLGA